MSDNEIMKRYGVLARPQSMIEFLTQTDERRLVIPVYQRSYSWEQSQCARLLNDMCELESAIDKKHFFGTIITTSTPATFSNVSIIDGQQRLITFSLFVAAFCALKNNARLRDVLCCDGKTKLDLSHIADDKNAYEAIILHYPGVTDFEKTKIGKAYIFFRESLKALPVAKLAGLAEACERLIVINMAVDTHAEHPQLIFDSINSTGVALEEGDKLCNYLLADLEDDDKQDRLFNVYWRNIRENVCGDKKSRANGVSAFVRTFLMSRATSEKHVTKESATYENFKEYCVGLGPSFSTDREAFFKKMQEDSLTYCYLLKPETLEKKHFDDKVYVAIAIYLEYIRRQSITAAYPFLFTLLTALNDKKVTGDDVLATLQIIDSFLFRRKVCKKPSNALQGIFVRLAGLSGQATPAYPLADRVLVELCSHSGNAGFPDDKEFEDALTQLDLYKKLGQPDKKYFFARLWNGKGHLASIQGDNTYHALTGPYSAHGVPTYTIEHIFPQTPEQDWKDYLQDDLPTAEKMRDKLGNLTVTAHNTELGNKTFSQKCELGFYFEASDRGNPLVADVLAVWKQGKKWDSHAIKARGEKLVAMALELWPRPEPKSATGRGVWNELKAKREVSKKVPLGGHGTLMINIWKAFNRYRITNKDLADAGFHIWSCRESPDSWRRFGIGSKSATVQVYFRSHAKQIFVSLYFYSQHNNTTVWSEFIRHQVEIEQTFPGCRKEWKWVGPKKDAGNSQLVCMISWNGTETEAIASFPRICQAMRFLKETASAFGVIARKRG